MTEVRGDIDVRLYDPHKPTDYLGMVSVLAATNLLDPRRDTIGLYNAIVTSRPDAIVLAELRRTQEIVGCGTADQVHPVAGSVAVRPDLQGQGVGTRILTALMDNLARGGHTFAEVIIDKDNPELRAFYERRGFFATDTCLLLERDLSDRATGTPRIIGDIGHMTLWQAFRILYTAPRTAQWTPKVDISDLEWHLSSKRPLTDEDSRSAFADVSLRYPPFIADKGIGHWFWGRLAFKDRDRKSYTAIRSVYDDEVRGSRLDPSTTYTIAHNETSELEFLEIGRFGGVGEPTYGLDHTRGSVLKHGHAIAQLTADPADAEAVVFKRRLN